MYRAHTYLILGTLIISSKVTGQATSLADLHGTWYFHQHWVDSVLFADADKPTPFPVKDYEMVLKAASAMPGAHVPDSATFAATLRQNDENYRHYQLIFNADSTYTTKLAPGMSKWLPVNGRLKHPTPDGNL